MTPKNEQPQSIWTESNFDQMYWHDSRVYAIAFDTQKFELMFDIDYITDWRVIEPPGHGFIIKFAPATLTFFNISKMDMTMDMLGEAVEIDQVSRTALGPPRNAQYIGRNIEWRWTIDCQHGDIEFVSTGFELILREPERPIEQMADSISQRGLSFSRQPFQQNV